MRCLSCCGFTQGQQQYECKACQYYFITEHKRDFSEKKVRVIRLYCSSGVSFRQIGRLESISPTSVRLWDRQYAQELPEAGTTIHLASVVELDEQWHFVEKSQKLWIWKAVDYETEQLLDREWGGRDTLTFRRLYERIERRFHPKLYCTEHWEAYRQVIPQDRIIHSEQIRQQLRGKQQCGYSPLVRPFSSQFSNRHP